MPEKKGIQHQCSFCKRVIDVHDQYDMPIFDPNTGFAICKNCVREINRFLDEHDAGLYAGGLIVTNFDCGALAPRNPDGITWGRSFTFTAITHEV